MLFGGNWILEAMKVEYFSIASIHALKISNIFFPNHNCLLVYDGYSSNLFHRAHVFNKLHPMQNNSFFQFN